MSLASSDSAGLSSTIFPDDAFELLQSSDARLIIRVHISIKYQIII
jgi:hypothetical protein